MEKSEILEIAFEKNTKSLETLFDEAGIDIENTDEEYGLFLIDDKFDFVTYITRNDSTWKGTFLSQNNAIFVGYIGNYVYQCLNFTDIVNDRVEELRRIEEEHC